MKLVKHQNSHLAFAVIHSRLRTINQSNINLIFDKISQVHPLYLGISPSLLNASQFRVGEFPPSQMNW